nr:hypothetical protein CFP56_01527 [Quercus suber]
MAKPAPQTIDLHLLHSFWFDHDRTLLLDLSLSTAIFVADGAPSPLHVVFVTDGAHHHCMLWILTEVNWVLILDENHEVTDQHNGQKVASKSGAKVGLNS